MHLEGMERPLFSHLGPPEEEIVEELRHHPPAELKNRSIRELEVLARHEIADWWGMDPASTGPMKILTKNTHPQASGAEQLIAIPDAESEIVILQWYDAMAEFLTLGESRDPLNANPDTPVIHDVYHEVGHIMAHSDEDEEINYTTLEEMVYQEALANVAALEKLGGLTEYQSEQIETLESLLDKSPEGHIDEILDHRDLYLAVIDEAEQRLAEIDPEAPPRDFDRQLTQYYRTMKSEQQEHDIGGIGIKDLSVKKAFEHDIFLFLLTIKNASVRAVPAGGQYDTEVTMLACGPGDEVCKTGKLEPFGATETIIGVVDDYLPFGLERRLLEEESTDYHLVMTPEEMLHDIQRYIERARSGVQRVNREDLKQFRAYLINDHVERWELAGHALGVEVGYQMYLDENLDAGEFARMPQEEGIRQLRPLIEESQEKYGLSLPLGTEIDYYDLEAQLERRKNILDIV